MSLKGLWVSKRAEEGEDLGLFQVPDTTLDVDVILEEINDAFLGLGDSNEAAAVKVKAGRVGALGDAI